MTKNDLKALFPTISPTAFVLGDSGFKIAGKWAEVEPVGDEWDIWLRNQKEPGKGLGARKINHILNSLESTDKTALQRLDGEAWFRVGDYRLIPPMIRLLGIRAKRKANPNAIRNLQ
jgi:hypothetical protein